MAEYSLDRFSQGLPDPQESKVWSHCDFCGGEIYRGSTYFVFGGLALCDEGCLDAYVKEIAEIRLAD